MVGGGRFARVYTSAPLLLSSCLDIPVLAAGAESAAVRTPVHAHNSPRVSRHLRNKRQGERDAAATVDAAGG